MLLKRNPVKQLSAYSSRDNYDFESQKSKLIDLTKIKRSVEREKGYHEACRTNLQLKNK